MLHCVFSPLCLCFNAGGPISSHGEALTEPQARYATSPLCHHYSTSRVTKLCLELGVTVCVILRPGFQN